LQNLYFKFSLLTDNVVGGTNHRMIIYIRFCIFRIIFFSFFIAVDTRLDIRFTLYNEKERTKFRFD